MYVSACQLGPDSKCYKLRNLYTQVHLFPYSAGRMQGLHTWYYKVYNAMLTIDSLIYRMISSISSELKPDTWRH